MLTEVTLIRCRQCPRRACPLQSDYNPVEEPSWNIAASFDAGVFQNGASWLSPLGSGAAAVSPPKASPQREQSEVCGTQTDTTCHTPVELFASRSSRLVALTFPGLGT